MSTEVKIQRESLKECLICDISTLGMMLLTFWFNYKFIDGNNFIDAILLLAIICKSCQNEKKYKGVSEEKLKQIEEILNN